MESLRTTGENGWDAKKTEECRPYQEDGAATVFVRYTAREQEQAAVSKTVFSIS